MIFLNFLKRNNRLIILALFVSAYFTLHFSVFAEAMQSPSYRIQSDSLDAGGDGLSSPNYNLNGTVDEINIDNLTEISTPNNNDSTGGGSFGYLKPQNSAVNNLPDTTPPGNPINVKAKSLSSGVSLTWTNPSDEDFDYIRIMRNKDRYYSNPIIGEVVYEGSGGATLDVNVLLSNRYFYTLYSRDKIGNYSSGSLVDILYKLQKSTSVVTPDNTTITPTEEVVEPYEPVPVKEIKSLPNDYIVSQGEFTTKFRIGNIVHLQINKPINVKIEYSQSTPNEDMWIEIIDEKNAISKYFFTVEKNQSGFMVVNVPQFLTGGYFSVNIYKYNNETPEIVNQGAFLLDNTPPQKNNFYSTYLSPIIEKLMSIISVIIGFFTSLALRLSSLFK